LENQKWAKHWGYYVKILIEQIWGHNFGGKRFGKDPMTTSQRNFEKNVGVFLINKDSRSK
jgi:hypothetical protein